MSRQEIEETINECKSMASEPVFNVDSGGFSKTTNHRLYANLLEELLRAALSKIDKLSK